MFELMLCSMFTLLPDYLYRRYAQGKLHPVSHSPFPWS